MKTSSCFLAIVLLLSLTGSAVRAFPIYYDVSLQKEAEKEARERLLPLAWVGSFPQYMQEGAPQVGGNAELTQLAIRTLQGNAVVIFVDAHAVSAVPATIFAPFHIHDDGELSSSGRADFISPKIVFSNPEATKVLGRITYAQLKADRDYPINSMIQVIKNDSTALAAPPPTPVPTAAPESSAKTGSASDSGLMGFIDAYALYIVLAVALVVAFLFYQAMQARRP